VAKIFVLQKGELADDAMSEKALSENSKVETMPLL
jgi:hypothetical protein